MEKTNMVSSVELITPEVARVYLDAMGPNRKVKKGDLGKYIHDMNNGGWVDDGAPIRFDVDGVLFDGQHRLLAIIATGISQWCVVVRGCDRNGRYTCDTGVRRSFADALAVAGVQASRDCTSIINRYYNVKNKRNFIRGDRGDSISTAATELCISNTDKQKEYFEHIDMYEWIRKMASRCTTLGLFTRADVGGTATYLIRDMGYDPQTVETFFIELDDLRGTCPPARLLREVCLRKNNNKGLKHTYKQALLVKAWNAYASRKDIKKLKYDQRREGKVWFLSREEADAIAIKPEIA